MAELDKPATPLVAISGDNEVARLVLPAGLDADTASLLSLRAIVKERHVELTRAVAEVIAAAAERYAECGGPDEVELARAVPAVAGTDAWLDWMPGFDPGTIATQPAADGDGAVSFYDLQSFVRVGEGDHVATLHKATEGTDGHDVCGRAIPATPGKRLGLSIDKSLVLTDRMTVVSKLNGVLKLTDGCLRVDPVLDIHGTVDFSTGHINFDGDVIVRQGIRDRFRVRATQNVTIDGLIDASHIACDGDLTARRGIAGRDEGTLAIGGDATVGYLDKVTGRIGGTLRFARDVMHCELTVVGDIVGERGRIIGGRLRVGGDARVAELGSRGDTPTHLVLGPVSHHEGTGGAAQTEGPHAELGRLQRALVDLRQNTALREPHKAALMKELESSITSVQAGLAATEAAATATRPGCTSTLYVEKMLHARVRLDLGGRTIVIGHAIRGPVRVWLEGDRVMHKIGDGTPAPMRQAAGVTDRLAA